MTQTALTADIICKEALTIVENDLGVLATFHRAFEDEFSKKVNGYSVGETVSIRRPHDPRPRRGATMAIQEVQEGKVALTVDQQVGHDFAFTSSDLTLRIEDLSERVIRPAMVNIVNDIVRDLFVEMYRGIYNWVGTPGQRIDAFNDFSKGPERLDELGVMTSDRKAALSPNDNWGMVGSQTTLLNGSLVNKGFTDGELGRLGGCDTYSCQVMPTHATGSRTNTTPLVDGAGQIVTYATAKDTWTSTILLKGAGNAVTYLKGDVFTIDGVFMVNPRTKAATNILQNFVVMADAATSGGGAATLTVSPPIISGTTEPHQTVSAAPADGAAIVNFGSASTSYRQNLVYHKNCMALAVVPMEIPQGAVNPTRQSYKGFSARMIPVYSGTSDTSAWRLDILYGRKLIDPRIATRISGTA